MIIRLRLILLISIVLFTFNNMIVAAPTLYSAKAHIKWTFDGNDQQQLIIHAVEHAQDSLEIAIFSITDPSIVFAIRKAHKNGIQVRIITDRMQAYTNTQQVALQILGKQGIPIKMNTHEGLMHLKMIITDRKSVLTGSYNFTKSANRSNDELIMQIKSRKFVNSCINEFGIMWNDADNFSNYSNY